MDQERSPDTLDPTLAAAHARIKVLDERQSKMTKNKGGKEQEPLPEITINAMSSFISQEFADAPYIVSNLIIDRGINMIAGPAGVGKTFVSLELILSMAAGRATFGHFGVPEAVPVLLVNEEDTARSLQKRFIIMGATADLPIHICTHQGIKLDDERYVDYLLEYVDKSGVKVIVMDNLTQLHMLDENKADEIKKIFFNFKRLTAAGCTVVLLHHQRKGGNNPIANPTTVEMGDQTRGSSVIYGSCDTHLAVGRADIEGVTHIILTQTKNKEDELVKPFMVKQVKSFLNETLSFEYVGEYEKSGGALMKAIDEVMALLEQKGKGAYHQMTKKEILEKLGHIGSRNVVEAILNLEERRMIVSKSRKELSLEGKSTEKLYWVPTRDELGSDVLFTDDFGNN